MVISYQSLKSQLNLGDLRRVHHIALNVHDMEASRHFYSNILGCSRIQIDLMKSIINFITTIYIDLVIIVI